MEESTKNGADSLGKALVFQTDGERWACELAWVKEIVRSPHLTGLPNAIEPVAGVINVRGEVVPVLSFWQEEQGESTAHSSSPKETVVILQSDEGNVGLRVKSVSSIEDIHAFDLDSSGKTPSKQEIVSCNVYLSESGPTPLVDVKLVMEFIKAQGVGKMGKKDTNNIDASSEVGGIR